jgi:hypothetical protein
MKAILCCLASLLFAVSCWAQKNELDMVLGNTWSLNSNTTLSTPGFPPVVGGTGQTSNLTYEVGLARRLTGLGPASLSLELTAAGFPSRLGGFGSVDLASVFIVPAARFSFLPKGAVSPFVSAGVGYAHLERGGFGATSAVASQFGFGADVKTPVRFLKLRGEFRDFLASQSGVKFTPSLPGQTVSTSSRNHMLLGAGVALRF